MPLIFPMPGQQVSFTRQELVRILSDHVGFFLKTSKGDFIENSRVSMGATGDILTLTFHDMPHETAGPNE